MPIFSALLSWLGLDRPSVGVYVRPKTDFTMACGFEQARERCLKALVDAAGASVQADSGNSIEAGFGIVNSERLRIWLEPLDASTTRIRVEATYPARLAPPPRSMAVDAITKALQDDDGGAYPPIRSIPR